MPVGIVVVACIATVRAILLGDVRAKAIIVVARGKVAAPCDAGVVERGLPAGVYVVKEIRTSVRPI